MKHCVIRNRGRDESATVIAMMKAQYLVIKNVRKWNLNQKCNKSWKEARWRSWRTDPTVNQRVNVLSLGHLQLFGSQPRAKAELQDSLIFLGTADPACHPWIPNHTMSGCRASVLISSGYCGHVGILWFYEWKFSQVCSDIWNWLKV